MHQHGSGLSRTRPMKILCHEKNGGRGRRRGFTLVEMVLSSGIYMLVFVGVIVAIQVFALRVYTLAATKLTATQGSRKALNQMRDDIRQGKGLLVGTADNQGHFVAATGTNGAVATRSRFFPPRTSAGRRSTSIFSKRTPSAACPRTT